MKKRINSYRDFINHGLWKIKLADLPKGKRYFYSTLRIAFITFTEFNKDKCGEKASALTYFSVLSVVPVIALAFGIATVFGLESYLTEELGRYFTGQQQVLDYTLDFADKMLSTSSGGIITGISALFLIYAVARLLNNIEIAFNDIWGSAKGRSLKRKMTDYMSVIFLGPIILILSSSAAVFLTTSVESIVEQINFLGFLMPIILFLIKLVPFFLVGFLLFLIFVVFPNTTVKLKPALIAGIVAGVVYQIIQYMWIDGQIYLSTYSVVYGSFAALPLFLIWLQLSWTVVLLGGELTFAIQNAKGWSHDDDKLRMSLKFKRKLTVYVLWKLTNSFRETDGPVSLASIHGDLHIPLRFLRQIITELEEAKLIVRVVSVTDEELYQPGLDINKITIIMIYSRLELVGFSEFPTDLEGEGFEDIVRVIEKLEAEMTNSSWNKKLVDL